jgi:hypothetical protein
MKVLLLLILIKSFCKSTGRLSNNKRSLRKN